jgi:hypothetical protein
VGNPNRGERFHGNYRHVPATTAKIELNGCILLDVRSLALLGDILWFRMLD